MSDMDGSVRNYVLTASWLPVLATGVAESRTPVAIDPNWAFARQ